MQRELKRNYPKINSYPVSRAEVSPSSWIQQRELFVPRAKELKPRSRVKAAGIPIIGLISLCSIVYFLYYLGWRTIHTLNPNALIFSWLLLIAEAFGVFNYILFSLMTQDISPVVTHKLPRSGIKVDVFVPTYNEGVDILEATLTGCNQILYPHTTYVLDDGNRAEVKVLARKLGCKYIVRDDNQHAKAGNINHALNKTSGEYIVILDADMVPQPEFLHRTLGYFENENLAYIQTPQEFFNLDSIQHDNKKISWHEQRFFYRVIQPGKNHFNAAFWCGSPSIIRRAALDDVGGVAVESITEDIHTSVRLHSKGWESLFINEVLAYGIAPQTMSAFLLQRLRWAQGTMQLYRSKDSPLWIRGLSIKQRISYLSSFLAYFESFQKLIFILTPTIIILFNLFPMRTDALSFLIRWTPYFLLSLLANQIGGRGYFRYFQVEKFNMLKMFIFIKSAFTLFSNKPLKFKVTPKSINNTVYQDERRVMRSFMAIFGLITGVVFLGLGKIIMSGGISAGLFSYLIALLWSSYNAILILTSLIQVLKKQHERLEYRFPVHLPSQIINELSIKVVAETQIVNISTRGAGLLVDGNTSLVGPNLLLCFFTPDHIFIDIPINKIHTRYDASAGKKYIGVSFGTMSDYIRSRLLEYIFIRLPQISYSERGLQPERDYSRYPLNQPMHQLAVK